MNKYTPIIVTAECGSLTKAAQTLGYTQPNLGHIISKIEDELNVKLFYRDQRGMHLTRDGEKLITIMKNIESLEEDLALTAKNLQSGIIKVGLMSSPAVNWMPEILSRFQESHPGIAVKMTQDTLYSETMAAVKLHTLECSFFINENITGLDVIPLYDDRYYVVVSEDSPLAELESITLADIEGKYPFVPTTESFDEVSTLSAIYKRLMSNNAVDFEPLDDQVVLSLVEKNIGYTILPDLILRKNVDKYSIRLIPISDKYTRQICLILPKEGERDLTTVEFANVVKEVVDDWKKTLKPLHEK